MKAQTKKHHFRDAFLVEHLEKSSPIIVDEIHRWRYLLWGDYIEYKREEEQQKKLLVSVVFTY
jgi:hypothetical protein